MGLLTAHQSPACGRENWLQFLAMPDWVGVGVITAVVLVEELVVLVVVVPDTPTQYA